MQPPIISLLLPRVGPSNHAQVPRGLDPFAKFWEEWDRIALKRKIFLKARPVNWKTVNKSLMASNELFRTSPDRQIQRVYRSPKLPTNFDLDGVGSLVYVICSHHPPYVGQTGRISQQRSLDRYKEHVPKARMLRLFFVEIRYRKVKGIKYYGKTPPPRLHASWPEMAQEDTPFNTHGGVPRRRWVTNLGVTLNQKLPFGGVDRLQWDGLIAKGQEDNKSQAMLHDNT